MPSTDNLESAALVEEFITRWLNSAAAERANCQPFLVELCELLAVPKPEPSKADVTQNAYAFERDVTFQNLDGTTSLGRIDLYKRGAFVLEAKQGSEQTEPDEFQQAATPKKLKKGTAVRGTKNWDDAMVKARGQAEQYARALPTDEGWPPFLIVVDVGHSIELFADFTRNGKTYLPFPDPGSYRIPLPKLAELEQREKLRLVWTDPLSLDPTLRSAKVTRELADRLAKLAKSLEASKFDPARVAQFLMRCLFTMFAEDVDLIPPASFTNLLKKLKHNPANFSPMVRSLWESMDKGTFHPVLEQKLRRFNGGLFEDCEALPLTADQLELLIEASQANWRDVEPAIFGTLLERALDPHERHKLGAHYTPRAYVERLVMPTIVEPLREEWDAVRAAAYLTAKQGDRVEAINIVRGFLVMLCNIRVLDPACGSGNFLYVAMEHLKRLEGEVLVLLSELDYGQKIVKEILTVDPHQFMGIEVNPRAAAIADLVLWIGYLQWHTRTRNLDEIHEPIIQKFHNIECRDAVLAWDAVEAVQDAAGQPVTRWDGRTMKKHPVTGEDVPDDTARIPVWKYINPRKAEWPEADFIVGNPPFIGPARMRLTLGDGYTEALRKTYTTVPESCDYVMYWWQVAAEFTASHNAQAFGFITTNSLRQTFRRKVVAEVVSNGKLSLKFAIPDHPWVETEDGAAVRIAMTSATAEHLAGRLLTVRSENPDGEGGCSLTFDEQIGAIYANLNIGANASDANALQANRNLSNRGVCLFGSGFIVNQQDAENLGHGTETNIDQVIKEYRNGKDLTQNTRNAYVIDLFGFTCQEAQQRFPRIYQWIVNYVKPERDQNRDAAISQNWWLHGRPRPELRAAITGLHRYIATVETAKHRVFQFLNRKILPDNKLIAIALAEGEYLGILSSRIHVTWSLSVGALLEDRPVYVKTECFEKFPFPAAPPQSTAHASANSASNSMPIARNSNHCILS